MKRILVVDDEDPIRDYLKEELTDEGYEVVLATSAPEALKIIEKEDLDLVILDIRMPGITGVEALPRILRAQRESAGNFKYRLLSISAGLYGLGRQCLCY